MTDFAIFNIFYRYTEIRKAVSQSVLASNCTNDFRACNY